MLSSVAAKYYFKDYRDIWGFPKLGLPLKRVYRGYIGISRVQGLECFFYIILGSILGFPYLGKLPYLAALENPLSPCLLLLGGSLRGQLVQLIQHGTCTAFEGPKSGFRDLNMSSLLATSLSCTDKTKIRHMQIALHMQRASSHLAG